MTMTAQDKLAKAVAYVTQKIADHKQLISAVERMAKAGNWEGVSSYREATENLPELCNLADILAAHDAEKGQPDGGYVLVPRVPTKEILFAMQRSRYGYERGDSCGQSSALAYFDQSIRPHLKDADQACWHEYQAMLAAAPSKPPAPEPGEDEPYANTPHPEDGYYHYRATDGVVHRFPRKPAQSKAPPADDFDDQELPF